MWCWSQLVLQPLISIFALETCTYLHDGLQWSSSVEQTHQDTCQVTNERGPEEEAGNRLTLNQWNTDIWLNSVIPDFLHIFVSFLWSIQSINAIWAFYKNNWFKGWNQLPWPLHASSDQTLGRLTVCLQVVAMLFYSKYREIDLKKFVNRSLIGHWLSRWKRSFNLGSATTLLNVSVLFTVVSDEWLLVHLLCRFWLATHLGVVIWITISSAQVA